MIIMPEGSMLVREMKNSLPLFCFSKKRNTIALAMQGVKLSEKIRLEVIDVRDFLDAGGVMCDIRDPQTSKVLIMSVTGLDFKDNGPIDEKITAYASARIEWLKQEERHDFERGVEERVKIVNLSNTQKVSRNYPPLCSNRRKKTH